MAELCFFMLRNGLLAGLCGVALCAAARWFPKVRRPAFLHLLWVLVLLRMFAPPVLQIDVSPLSDLVGGRLQYQAEQPVHVLHFSLENSRELVYQMVKSKLAPETLQVSDPMPFSSCFKVTKLQLDQSLLQTVLDKARSAKETLVALAERVLFPLWILGGIVCILCQLVGILLFARLAKQESYDSRIWQRRAERVAKKMGFQSCPRLLLVRAKVSPMLWGFGPHTCILFPERLLEGLTIKEQDTLIAHELAHYRRGDQWVRLLELAGMVVFWWHPIYWLARHEIERSEECCCDAWAVRQANGNPRTYANALLATVDFLSVGYLPPAASAVGGAGFLRERLHAIMRAPLERRRNLLPESYPGILALGVLVLVPTPVFLSHQSGSGLTRANTRASFARRDRELETGSLPPHSIHQSGRIRVSSGALAPDVEATRVDWRDCIQLHVDESNRAVLKNTATGREFQLGVGRVSSASFSADGVSVAIGSNDGTVDVIDCRSLEILTRLQIGSSRVTSVSLSADGQLLAAGTANAGVQLIRLEMQDGALKRETLTVRRVQGERVRSVSFSKNGQSLAIIWQRVQETRAEFVQVRDGSVTTSSLLDAPVAVVFDDVVSRTSPPLWRFATREGKLFSLEDDKLMRLTGIGVSDAELRRYRIPLRP